MKSNLPQYPREALKQASAATTLANQARRLGQYGKNIFMHNGKFNPIQGVPRALKKGYDTTAVATSPAKSKNMISDALTKAKDGMQVDDVATGAVSGGKIRQYLRNKGWLSVGRKTSGRYNKEQQEQINKLLQDRNILQGTGKYKDGVEVTRVNQKLSQNDLQDALLAVRKIKPADKAKLKDRAVDAAYNILPGEKSLLVGFGGLGAGAELAQTHTAEGRKKSLAERVGRAGTIGTVETLAAPLGIARRFGTLGIAGEIGSTIGAPIGMAIGDKVIGNPAMKKRASAYEDLTPSQKALLHHRLTEQGMSAGYKTPKDLKVGLVDGINPLKLKENYQKHRKNQKLMEEHMAKRMFGKQASISPTPRAALRRALK